MAPDNFLYIIHRLRVPGIDVEDTAPAPMGGFDCFRMASTLYLCSDSLSLALIVIRGVVATCQAALQNWSGAMALRFLLGATEAGFGPGVPYLLSFFYRRHELGLRCGLFVSAAPLANTFAGALAYGITSGHPKLASWRLLYLVEGIPTVLAAPFAWFFLPDRPTEAKFLTEEEKKVARARGLRQHGEVERNNKLDWKEIGLTLLDAKSWFTAVRTLIAA